MTPTGQTDERRRAPRFTIRLPAVTQGITLHTTNLSCSGTQLVCPALSRQLLREQLDRKSLHLSLEFPDLSKATIHCRLVYESDIGDESLLGIQFIEFESDSRQQLYRYIEQQAGSGFLV